MLYLLILRNKIYEFSTQSEFDQVFPLDNDAAVIVVGMRGDSFPAYRPVSPLNAFFCHSEASASNAYPATATNIDDFSQPEVITCMVEATFSKTDKLNFKNDINVIDGNEDPVGSCGAPTRMPRPPLTILFVNDFTSDFVGDYDAMVKMVTE